MSVCEVYHLGSVDYAEALALQDTLVRARAADETPDRLLLLEHPHTFTLGTSADEAHLLWDEAERARHGVAVYRVDRGGDITYHGPGQLVGYPILKLPRSDDGLRADFVGHVRRLETALMAALADYGVAAFPIAGLTGVWTETAAGTAKIAALGVRINARGVTKHGFAVNLNTDLTYFDGIIPCGIRDRGVTSLAALLGRPVEINHFADRFLAHFGTVFGCTTVEREPARLNVCLANDTV